MNKFMTNWSVIVFFSITATSLGQTPASEYVHSLIRPSTFPDSIALRWEVQREKIGHVDLEDAELNKGILRDYYNDEAMRNKYTNSNDFVAMVKSNLLASTNRIFRSSERIAVSARGRHLQTTLLDNQSIATEVVQMRNDENEWKTLRIDHKLKSAAILSGEKEIFGEYHETGLFCGTDRLLLVSVLRSFPDLDSAILALCTNNCLLTNGRSVFFEAHSGETPYYLVTYKNNASSLSIEYRLNPSIPGVLISKRTSSPQYSIEWSFEAPPAGSNSTMFPQSAHMIKKDASGNIVEQEWRTLESIQPSSTWDISNIWAEKVGEISNYQVIQ